MAAYQADRQRIADKVGPGSFDVGRIWLLQDSKSPFRRLMMDNICLLGQGLLYQPLLAAVRSHRKHLEVRHFRQVVESTALRMLTKLVCRKN